MEKLNAALLFVTGTCAAFSALWGRGWAIARFPALALMPLMLLLFARMSSQHPHQHPLAGFGLAGMARRLPVPFADSAAA